MIVVDGSKGFAPVIEELLEMSCRAEQVENRMWQGVDVSGRPDMRLRELRNVVFEVDLGGAEDLDWWRGEIRPDLPWADDHFEERVGGRPLNPGEAWRTWPHGGADGHRDPETGRFNHTYMERMWSRSLRPGHGDLQDLVGLLLQDPSTRQAWFPLFWPTETRIGVGERKMCSLGYQFLCREGRLHMYYPLRSCDVWTHLRNDCYLAVRMLLWVLGRCRSQSQEWGAIEPGTYCMHMTSLHLHEGNRVRILKRRKED